MIYENIFSLVFSNNVIKSEFPMGFCWSFTKTSFGMAAFGFPRYRLLAPSDEKKSKYSQD